MHTKYLERSKCLSSQFKIWYQGTGEMAQQLRALAAFLEDMGSISGIHMVAHNNL